jgi:3-deoxy-7-phosphoheptulonate synthase
MFWSQHGNCACSFRTEVYVESPFSMKRTFDQHIKGYHPIISPKELMDKLPLGRGRQTVLDARREIEQILEGQSNKKLLVVGPCSIHDPEAALEYARRLKAVADRCDKLLIVMRAYFEKPRTTVGWKGFINDPHHNGTFEMEEGLTQARKLLVELDHMGMPAATEALDPITIQYFADLIAWAAIGARTTESQTHREMASGLSMPVGFKNTTDGNVDAAVNAIKASQVPHTFLGMDENGRTSIVSTTGNAYGHIILRGGDKPNYDADSVARAIAKLTTAGMPARIMIDCSHGNSAKDYTRQPSVFRNIVEQLQENSSIIGMMLESHLSLGSQPIAPQLKYGVSITDPCIGWDATEELLLEIQRGNWPTAPVAQAQPKT